VIILSLEYTQILKESSIELLGSCYNLSLELRLYLGKDLSKREGWITSGKV